MIDFGVGSSTLVVALFLLLWLRFNRSLSLVGSGFAGALLVSGLMDSLLAWGSDDRWLAIALPLMFVALAIFLIRIDSLIPTRRWVVFGLVSMFMIRALVLAPTHATWSGRLSGSVREWLVLAGLDPSVLPRKEEPPPVLSDIEMPCGLGRFSVKSDAIKPVTGAFQLRIEACGFSPQAFSVRGSEIIEISNALEMAVQISFAPQDEEGEYLNTMSVVVPPQSSIEVADFKVPVGGSVLVYAPLEPHLGSVLGVNVRVPGEYWVSRQPLTLKRQALDVP